LYNPRLNARLAQERYNDMLRQAERRRQAAQVRVSRLTLTRRAARPLGRALLHIGSSLLRYGLVEQPTTRAYRPSVRSIKLN
jgi:hypothetical protein